MLRGVLTRAISSGLLSRPTTSRVSTQISRNFSDMALTFASPEQVHYENAVVRQVDVPSMSGNFGILAEHVPTLAVLKPGVLAVTESDGAVKKYFVSSGSVTVNDDSSVQILAEAAVTLDQIDGSTVKDGLSKAQQEFTSASSEQAKAEAQIAVECFEALSKALEEK